MRRILLAAIFIAAATIASPVRSGEPDPWVKYGEQLRAFQATKAAGIATFAKEYRDKRCPVQASEKLRTACTDAFNLLIARANAERAGLKLTESAIGLSPEIRDQLLKDVVSPADYAKADAESARLFHEISAIFPEQKQASTTGRKN